MTTQNDDLLKAVRKQQAKIYKQQTQIEEILKHNGQLINELGTHTNTGGATSAEAENTHRGRYQRKRNNTGNRNTNNNNTGLSAVATSNNRTNNSPKCNVCPLRLHATADFWELDKNKSKRHDNWSTLLK